MKLYFVPKGTQGFLITPQEDGTTDIKVWTTRVDVETSLLQNDPIWLHNANLQGFDLSKIPDYELNLVKEGYAIFADWDTKYRLAVPQKHVQLLG